MTAAAEMWERAYRAGLDARRQTPAAQTYRERYEQRRAAGLCGGCGRPALTASCETCKAKTREAYRGRIVTSQGRKVRPHRRKEMRP
jgi:hypothetical protein